MAEASHSTVEHAPSAKMTDAKAARVTAVAVREPATRVVGKAVDEARVEAVKPMKKEAETVEAGVKVSKAMTPELTEVQQKPAETQAVETKQTRVAVGAASASEKPLTSKPKTVMKAAAEVAKAVVKTAKMMTPKTRRSSQASAKTARAAATASADAEAASTPAARPPPSSLPVEPPEAPHDAAEPLQSK